MRFSKFFLVLEGVRTYSDLFECIARRLDAFRSVQRRVQTFLDLFLLGGNLGKFGNSVVSSKFGARVYYY